MARPQFEIFAEQESDAGWMYEARVLNDEGRLSSHRLTLSWADYNLWSRDGSDPPVKVAEAALAFLVSKMPIEELPTKIDASLARRRFSDADAVIPSLIQ